MSKEKKLLLNVYKDLIDDIFLNIEAGGTEVVSKAWKKLSLLVGNNGDAAEALVLTLTPPRLKIIKDAALVEDKEIIDSSLEVQAAMISARKRQIRFLKDRDVPLEVYAENNLFRAVQDKAAREKSAAPKNYNESTKSARVKKKAGIMVSFKKPEGPK